MSRVLGMFQVSAIKWADIKPDWVTEFTHTQEIVSESELKEQRGFFF
jgi:hypothetical protein